MVNSVRQVVTLVSYGNTVVQGLNNWRCCGGADGGGAVDVNYVIKKKKEASEELEISEEKRRKKAQKTQSAPGLTACPGFSRRVPINKWNVPPMPEQKKRILF